ILIKRNGLAGSDELKSNSDDLIKRMGGFVINSAMLAYFRF
ncbi:hypothetical protein TrRE_jg5759, partial [Triparma retinervis]